MPALRDCPQEILYLSSIPMMTHEVYLYRAFLFLYHNSTQHDSFDERVNGETFNLRTSKSNALEVVKKDLRRYIQEQTKVVGLYELHDIRSPCNALKSFIHSSISPRPAYRR